MITYLLLIIIYIAFVNLGLPDSLLGPAWPLIHKDLRVPLHYAGIIAMIGSAGTVVSSVFSGHAIRRLGTGLLTALSVLMTGAALFGFSYSRQFWWLCLFTVPLGLGAGAVDSALNHYVALHFKARQMSWLHCFWGVGASAGPLILSAYLSAGAPWQAGYRLVGIIQFGMAAVLFAALPLWNRHYAIQQTGSTPQQSEIISIARAARLPGFKLTLAVFFCYCSAEAITGLWGGTYLVSVRNLAPESAARHIAFFYGGITAGRFISGFLTERFNNRTMVRLGAAVSACGVILLFIPATVMLIPAFLLIGLGFAPVYPSLLHETPRSFGAVFAQRIIGLQMASAYIGITLMPPLFGRIAGMAGWALYPAGIALFFLAEILFLIAAFRKIDSAHAPN